MSEQNPWCPTPPDYAVNWEWVEHDFPQLSRLAGCPQDAVHHAEGDVLIHTWMVVESLVSLPGWRALSRPEREIVFAAALLHDIAKPDCTRVEEGRITSRSHSKRGAIKARTLLWGMNFPFEARGWHALRLSLSR